MKSFERGIGNFIEYKRSVENERPMLSVEKRIITVDGVDGSGKSTITKLLLEKLQNKYGDDAVVLVDITNLKGSSGQERLREVVKHHNPSDLAENRIYTAGVNRAYSDLIIPALEQGKIVLVDRSEVDLFRFALESKNESLIEEREQYIAEGTPTHRIWAGNRVFIDADPQDIWDNLSRREHLSKYDPQNYEEVVNRIEVQKIAESEILNIPHEGDVNVVREKNRRIDNVADREAYMDTLSDSVIERLKF